MASSGASYAGSGGSSKSSFSAKRQRPGTEQEHDHGDNLLDRGSSLEYGIFGVLFTLSKEKGEHRIRHRWVLLKILLDGWQLFTTVINPIRHNWNINPDGTAWVIVGVLNFTWLGDRGYDVYIAVLYAMLALLAINIVMCVWVAWCFKEHKFPVVWPIKVLRVFSSVFFQAFDVASLNLLQLGITCRFTGPAKPHLHFDLFPQYSCTTTPHILHAVVSALCLILFVAIALLLNMAEVEVNPLSRRPMALGHSGAEVMAFAIKVLLTLVNVFLGWDRVEASVYLALSIALAWQIIRWNSHLVSWVNYLKSGVYLTVVWSSSVLMLLVFHPGMKAGEEESYSKLMTLLLLVGLAPAFGVGVLLSWASLRHLSKSALKGLDNPRKLPLNEAFGSVDEPRDIEIASRCCRVWKEPGTPDPEAVNKAHMLIKAGLEMFPHNSFMVLLHANFMIDVLGVSQSGSRRIEDARKLNPSLMCRFVMFVRQQQATQSAAGSSVNSSATMDLLGYVEYQRKQRMVVRLHREALQAMCSFWKMLDASSVSFTHLSKALGKIETSVSQAQRAYRVVLESYGNNPKLVHLYGRFLQTIKNDPWHAAEYFAEAERLEELQDSNASGPLMPDGTPLSRMDEIDTAVLVLNAAGEVQMANRHTQFLFGYKRGILEGKPLATLLAPHFARRLSERLASIAAAHELLGIASPDDDGSDLAEETVVGLHCDRLAFPAKLTLRKASGVGEDSTIIALIEPVSPAPGVCSVWVTHNGIVTACDPSFVANFGWKAAEVNGTSIKGLITFAGPAAAPNGSSGQDKDKDKDKEQDKDKAATAQRHVPRQNESASELIKRLLAQAAEMDAASGGSNVSDDQQPTGGFISCRIPHKYMCKAVACTLTVVPSAAADAPIVHELRIKTDSEPVQLLAVNRKGAILHASSELATRLKDRSGLGLGSLNHHAGTMLGSEGQNHGGGGGGGMEAGMLGGDGGASSSYTALLHGYTLFDFLAPAWKDMHFKLLKDVTAVSPLPVAELACRKSGSPPGPTLELRTAGGREMYMRVGVSTNEIQGEVVHIVHLSRSSLDSALAERRLRLSLSPDGLISAVEAGSSSQLFGLDTSKMLGRGLWEVVEEPSVPAAGAAAAGRMSATGRASNGGLGGRTSASLISRALRYPGHSWRVQVVPPPSLAARASFTPLAKPAIMQLHVAMPPDDDEAGVPTVSVDLWPSTTVTGVLDLDPLGRIRAVLEERTRPVGLLFGVPGQSLVGSTLAELVAMPQGRTRPGDLLSLHGTKKSSLKSQAKEASVKVGPVHTLRATHWDGRPLSLDVQVVGKPGPNEPATAILRFHVAPMMPRLLAAPPQQPLQPPPPAATAGGAAATAKGALWKSGGEAAPPGGGGGGGRDLVLIDAPVKTQLAATGTAAAPPPAVVSPQRTPSLDDPTPRTSSPVYDQPGNNGVLLVQQQPPVVRSLTTPPAAKTPPASGFVPLDSLDYAMMEVGCQEPPPEALPGSADGGGGAAAGRPLSLPPPAADADAATPGALGRSRLSDLVKSVGGPSGRSVPRRQQTAFISDVGGVSGGGGGGGGSLRLGTPSGGVAGGRSFKVPGAVQQSGYPEDAEEEDEDACAEGDRLSDVAGSDSDGHGGGLSKTKEAHGRSETAGRVLEWVASKGAFYQNTPNDSAKGGGRFVASTEGFRPTSFADGVEAGDDGAAAAGPGYGGAEGALVYPAGDSFISEARGPAVLEGGVGIGVGFGKGRGPPGPGMEDMAPSFVVEDDAASDGGQSAVSGAQSATGSEYTRGKRFRKLAKLMDSSQTKQVQKRLRIHALFTVAVLATTHVICFVLTVTAIKSQQNSMTQLGRSGQAQLYLHRILIDVRGLDIISRDKWLPNLFTPDDAEALVERITHDAEEVKVRLNEILNTHSNSPSIIKLLYQTKRTVWDTNDADGSDIYTNLTIWDFATRFYSMAKAIKQMHSAWMEDKQYIADTFAGQFLLKSGPDLFIDTRKMLDALLYNAVDNARHVDILQIVFLLVEGAAISFIAACYLMFLLRAVAAQRFKLYSTFLVIPVGLTRALASQNTSLLVDDDDDDDGDEDEERGAQAAAMQEAEDGGGNTPKLRRRATLKVEESATEATLPPTAVPGGTTAAAGWRRTSATDDPSSRKPYMDRGFDKFDKQRTLTTDSDQVLSSGCCGWMNWRNRLRNVIGRRSSILPLPMSTSISGVSPILASMGSSKRSLRFDSNETIFMLLPFIVWSVLVVAVYSTAVVRMQGVDEVVAVHSVVNFMSARTSRTVFFGQELANTEDPNQLMARREALLRVVKLTRDAWYTLQLGEQAYTAVGDDCERFPLVKSGLSHASTELMRMFYSSGSCHRTQEHLPCPGDDYRFYQLTHTGLDSMMQQFMISLSSMGKNTSLIPEGLEDEHWDIVYNVGYKDLLDGTVRIAEAHYDTILALFNSILILHIILFLLFWVIFAGFLMFMLNPLLRRVSQERRRIAELMSQLPLELDVERLVARALGTTSGQSGAAAGGGADGDRSLGGGGASGGGGAYVEGGGSGDAVSKWKAIIRASSSLNGGKGQSSDGRRRP
ncbi:hypothetical protein PLESTB_001103800 [Pleodorina starrii]|uniref:TmcB/TmcC TPR repeats domain-containing protein n=1 Tax=Pleodorina starrii TaxID=330485 RepID=A0A9W6F4Q2_9CHLO|nr:hypothetical protein PLESTM_001338700 [Pleodorina starrii]GLC56428.1 hypothetical protein PLESTB_001103800 [Pleodorina starrii]GLC68928.1 hypothetical protein PLESTF_000760000 [Pleodorina starrii]